ncbi:MAG TPA: bacillithiol biosynthesis deacetylase BshB1 [Planctomycetota bacterium]|nr:bacillithiol biosynthesis deacetylase BshB1 [Planctomycetota bacterium]
MNLAQVLAVGAHPDDVELGCGGLLLAMRARGHRFAILDLTAGEKGSRGTAEERAKEAQAAAAVLGATARECLHLPDTRVEPTAAAVRAAVEAIRRWRPQLVVSMNPADRHPDHAAAARIVENACFLAALPNFDAPGAPHRPRRVVRYSRHTWFAPSFVVDITDHVEKKLEAIRCYRSQFTRAAPGAKTPISAPDFEEDLRAFWRFHGQGIGALYAEPFAMDGPPAVPDPVAALCAERRDF